MIHSMTGFGRSAGALSPRFFVAVTAKSVNHRFLEAGVRHPEYLWELEQPAHAVANGYFVGAINRVGEERPWSIGEFYGKSYFCNPRGKIVAQASRNQDEVLVADLDLDMILEVRKVWQFFRDRRPESYGVLTKQSGRAGSGD